MRKRQMGLGRVLRRSGALCLGLVTAWSVWLTADMSAAADALDALGESPAFVAAALEAELGSVDLPAERVLADLGFWEKLVVNESPLLLAAGRDDEAEEEPEQEQMPANPDDAQEENPETVVGAETVVERTLGVNQEQDYDYNENIYINNQTSQAVDVAALASAAVEIELPQDGPQILIMHTHATEAYTMSGSDVYEESDSYRTTDCNYNVVRVGSEIASCLEAAGFSVLHDETLYDYPEYNGSYNRSLAGVQAYLKQYPSIKIVMDVHRDALVGKDGTVYKTITEVNGEKTAQVMLVMGSNDSGLEFSTWQKNLTLAIKVQGRLNAISDTLARPINLRTARFNQQLTTGSMLVEVGSHGNTLQEALAAARLFAGAAAAAFQELV